MDSIGVGALSLLRSIPSFSRVPFRVKGGLRRVREDFANLSNPPQSPFTKGGLEVYLSAKENRALSLISLLEFDYSFVV